MQKTKGLVLLSFVLIIICVVLSILMLSIISILSSQQNLPLSYPSNTANTIRIVPQDLEKYIYATISSEDTIILKDLTGEKKVINLEKKKWKDIQWNNDFSLVSVLGVSKEGKYNLFIYNLATGKWDQITFYSDYDIDQLLWVSGDEILFLQGKVPERWLHSYKYSSKGMAIKLKALQGDLVRTSNDKRMLVFKTDEDFVIRDKNGELIVQISDLKADFVIREVMSLFDPTKLVLVDSEGQLHLYDLIDEKFEDIILEDEDVDSKLVCATEDGFWTYYVNERSVNISKITPEKASINTIVERFTITNPADVSLEKCTNSDFLIRINSEGSVRWYNLNVSFPELLVLKEDFDVDVKIDN